jgi:hypothetical protein
MSERSADRVRRPGNAMKNAVNDQSTNHGEQTGSMEGANPCKSSYACSFEFPERPTHRGTLLKRTSVTVGGTPAAIAAKSVPGEPAPTPTDGGGKDKERGAYVKRHAPSTARATTKTVLTSAPFATHKVDLVLAPDPEAAWRVGAMRAHLPGAAAVPFLLARSPEGAWGDNACISCGDALTEVPVIGAGRCGACRAAVWLVAAAFLRETPVLAADARPVSLCVRENFETLGVSGGFTGEPTGARLASAHVISQNSLRKDG